MPTGIYKRTKKHNKAISNSLKGKEGWSKGLTKKTDSRLLKMSQSLKGKRKSPKTEFKSGHIPWNKGTGKFSICQTCNKEFYTQLNIYKNPMKGKFCSMKCRRERFSKIADNFKLDGDTAELIGVMIGDGCIFNHSNGNITLTISGNKIEDKYYMESYLPKLIKKCISQKTKPSLASNGAYVIRFDNKAFAIFLNRLGITQNKVKKVRIPKQIMKNEKLLKRCIEGIADTDFTLIFSKRSKNRGYYPRITASFASKNLVIDLEKSLRNMNFTLNTIYDSKLNDNNRKKVWVTNSIHLDGPHNLKRWIDLIGFANLRIISRHELWKKEGFLDSKTTLPERLKRLGWVGGDFYEQNYPSD